LNGYTIPSEAEAVDVKSAALGMIKIFQTKSYQLPSTNAIRAFKSLVTHLESHYRKQSVFEKCHVIRSLVNFDCMNVSGNINLDSIDLQVLFANTS